MSFTVVPANLYESQNAYRRLQMNLTLDDPKTAIIEIKMFLKIYPDVAMACNDLGVLYLREGERLLALACYEKANRLQPCTPDIVKNLAEFYFVELGWTDDAIMMLTEILRAHPEDCELLSLLGVISERINRQAEACSFFSRVVELDPYNMQARDALARLGVTTPETPVFAKQQPQQTQAPVQPVYDTPPAAPVSIPPTAPAPSGGLDEVLARLRATLNKASQTSPATPSSQPVQSVDELYREAQGNVSTGNSGQALALLERIVAIDPTHALAHNDLGVLYSQSGDFDRARFHNEAAVSSNPANAVFRKNLAALYYSCLGRTDEAIGIYTKLLREFPTDVETLTALAIISQANNLREQARSFISKVLSIEPWNSDARAFLAGL
ncbi:MAG: tetratricopeptide repeat protein [Pedobacter sp.]